MVAWTFVGIQAALIVGIIVTPGDDAWRVGRVLEVLGTSLVVLGLVIGLWAAARLGRGLTPSPLPNGAVDLVTRGPYRWVRHPMYTAVMLIAAGVTVPSGSLLVAAQAVALMILFNVKARWEEGRLAATFPGYAGYQAATPRFVPFTR